MLTFFMNRIIVDVLRTRQPIPEVMEEVCRDGAEDRECQCGEPVCRAENDREGRRPPPRSPSARREHSHIGRLFEAIAEVVAPRSMNFSTAGTDEDNPDQDPADGQDRIVHSGRSANIGMYQVASHGVHAHRNAPAMDPLENAAALRSVPERPHRAICTIWPRNLYSAVGGITLWHVIRSRGAVAVRVLACPLVLSGDVSCAT